MEKTIDITEWHRQRRLGIGGSDVGAICGFNKWKTALDVFLEKTGQAPVTEENSAMRLGTFLEPFIVKCYEEETGLKCVEQQGMFHDGIIVANIDRIVDMGDGRTQCGDKVISSRILECKTSRFDWDEGVPFSYQAQVQWYMGAFDAVKETDVAVYYTAGQKEPFHIFNVKKDEQVYKELYRRCEEFWNKYVLTGTMPPPQTTDDARFIWAKHKEGKSKTADAIIREKVSKLISLKEQEDKIGEEKEKVITEIMKFMGNAEVLKDSRGVPLVTWKTAKDSVSTDWKSIVASLKVRPEIIKRYTSVKPGSRKFLVK